MLGASLVRTGDTGRVLAPVLFQTRAPARFGLRLAFVVLAGLAAALLTWGMLAGRSGETPLLWTWLVVVSMVTLAVAVVGLALLAVARPSLALSGDEIRIRHTFVERRHDWADLREVRVETAGGAVRVRLVGEDSADGARLGRLPYHEIDALVRALADSGARYGVPVFVDQF